MKRAIRWIILDRDGVINRDSDQYVRSPEEWIPLPGSIEAIARLSRAGFPVTVATNQSGLARGYFDENALHAMHHKMNTLVQMAGGRIEAVAWCPHGPDDGCSCRKPQPGLIDQLSHITGLRPDEALLVGDSLRDLQAGRERGCALALVRTGKGTGTERRLAGSGLEDVPIYDDLSDVVRTLLNEGD